MAQEIERKFLVKEDFTPFYEEKIYIKQGYLSIVPERTVRIRITDKKAFITIKGKASKTGISRYEWEKEINITEANELFNLCEYSLIEKTRYIIPTKNNLYFEVDVFYGDNKGLVIAEIELPSENTIFEKPSWLGKEVTGIEKYYNSMLVKNPFVNWKV